MYFNTLPDEIIIYIFTFIMDFVQLRGVSQHFNKIIQMNKYYMNDSVLTQYLHTFETYNIDCIFENATKNNYITIINLLLDERLYPNCIENTMCIAAQFNYVEIIVLILQNIDIDMDIYTTTLSMACSYNTTKIVSILLHYTTLDDYTWMFVNAVVAYNVETIHLLLNYVCDNACSFAMDNIAMIKSNNINREIETYKLLLSRAYTDIINKTFYNIVKQNNKPIVKLFIPYISLDALQYQEILLHAIKNNNKSLVAILLTNLHAHVSIDKNINLIIAGQKNYKTIIQMLLAHPNMNVNIPDIFIFTHAVACVHPILTELLLSDGRADPCANHNEALHNACVLQNREIACLLIADPRTSTNTNDVFDKNKNYHVMTYKKINV